MPPSATARTRARRTNAPSTHLGAIASVASHNAARVDVNAPSLWMACATARVANVEAAGGGTDPASIDASGATRAFKPSPRARPLLDEELFPSSRACSKRRINNPQRPRVDSTNCRMREADTSSAD